MQPLRSKAHIQKKKQSKRKMLILLPITMAVLLGGFFYYAFASRFHVQQVIVSGTSFIKKEAVEASVDSMLKTTLWGFVPRMSPLLIGNKLIAATLAHEYPAIDHVKVDIHDDALFIDITERKAVSIMCSSSSVCYYLDIKGFAFAPAPTFEGSAFLKIATFEKELSVAQYLVPSEELERIIKIVEIYKSQGLIVQYVSFESADQMNIVTVGDTAFIVRRQDSVKSVQERLQALLSSRPEVKQGGYEYVDLRIESKIFLKNKES
ncbi:MAG: hypothetical protein RLY57_701 [Candidatus Parcubacteria bacterium]|jgi:hypothetical protein